MEKIKYDSLYKFIVSIGIAIIVFPFMFMIWIFNFNDIVIISNNEINQLSETAQNIIYLEQNYKYNIITSNNLFSCSKYNSVKWRSNSIIWNKTMER